MLAEPLQVDGYVIEQVVGVLINQFLQRGVATSLTNVQHGAQSCLVDQQCFFPGFLEHGV